MTGGECFKRMGINLAKCQFFQKNALRIRGARYMYLLQLFGDEVQRQLIQLRFHTGEIHAGGQ